MTFTNSILPEGTEGADFHDLTAFLMKFNAKSKNTTEILVRKMSRNLIIPISEIQTSLLLSQPKIVRMIRKIFGLGFLMTINWLTIVSIKRSY